MLRLHCTRNFLLHILSTVNFEQVCVSGWGTVGSLHSRHHSFKLIDDIPSASINCLSFLSILSTSFFSLKLHFWGIKKALNLTLLVISPSLFHMDFLLRPRYLSMLKYQLTAQENCSQPTETLHSHCSNVLLNYIISNRLRYREQHTWVMNNIKITVSNTAQALLPAIWTLLSRHPLPACT